MDGVNYRFYYRVLVRRCHGGGEGCFRDHDYT